ncbi:hypothetical protein GCM10025795_02170 [Verticiella sediminum]
MSTSESADTSGKWEDIQSKAARMSVQPSTGRCNSRAATVEGDNLAARSAAMPSAEAIRSISFMRLAYRKRIYIFHAYVGENFGARCDRVTGCCDIVK